MGIFDFFRRRKKQFVELKPMEPEWKVTLTDDPYEGKFQTALGLQTAGREQEAEVLLRQIIAEKKEYVRAWYALAEIYIATNAVGRALYCFERIVEYQPSNGSAIAQISNLQRIVRNRPDYLWEYNKEKGVI